MGVGNTTDTSTEQNPCALIQLWISFNCQNPSDENHPLEAAWVMISLLFLHQHSVHNIKQNYNKKGEEHLVLIWSETYAQTPWQQLG